MMEKPVFLMPVTRQHVTMDVFPKMEPLLVSVHKAKPSATTVSVALIIMNAATKMGSVSANVAIR